MKIIDYKILHKARLQDLEREININITEGWELYGNLNCKTESHEYIQTMVKCQKENTNEN